MANETGRCHICGKDRRLSFEHIPPRSMGNDHSIKSYRGVDIIEKTGGFDTSTKEGVRYAKMRRGAGFRTLCKECNSYLGANYVREFAGCIKELKARFIQDPPSSNAKSIHLEGGRINVLAFFKHVISNFCATTPCGSMADCRTFLLDKESNDFPDRYRLYMYAIPDPNSLMITTGWMTLFSMKGVYTLAHIAMFPVGFTLLNTAASSLIPPCLGYEITAMADQKWGVRPNLILDLPLMHLKCMLPIPVGDKPGEAISRHIRENMSDHGKENQNRA